MYKLSIKNWAVEDRPREKFITKGRDALSDAELLAIILGSGNGQQSAVELARQILADNDNNLSKVAKLSVSQLMRYRGVGEAKQLLLRQLWKLAEDEKKNLKKKDPW